MNSVLEENEWLDRFSIRWSAGKLTFNNVNPFAVRNLIQFEECGQSAENLDLGLQTKLKFHNKLAGYSYTEIDLFGGI